MELFPRQEVFCSSRSLFDDIDLTKVYANEEKIIISSDFQYALSNILLYDITFSTPKL